MSTGVCKLDIVCIVNNDPEAPNKGYRYYTQNKTFKLFHTRYFLAFQEPLFPCTQIEDDLSYSWLLNILKS